MNTRSCLSLLTLLLLSMSPVFAADSNPLLDGYVQISSALAADDLGAAEKAAAELATVAQPDNTAMAEQAEAVAASDSLEAAREKFRPLSKTAVEMAEKTPGYTVMTCPMAKGDWVQKDKKIANPYFGKSMLRCGSIKSE